MVHFFRSKIYCVTSKLLCGFFLCLSTLNYAQVFYSVNPNYLKSKTEQNNLLTEYKNNFPDTAITEQANYFPKNYMGNLGLASPDYIWRYGSDDIGFRFVQSPLTIDRFKESEVRYYRTKGPFASLNGIAGSKELQIFKMLFTQTYKGKVNFTIGFNRYTSKGFYQRQQTYANNVYLSSNYATRKKNAGYYFYILNNGNKNSENGGIQDGVITDSSLVFDKELFRVNLSSAKRDNRELKVMINPWLRLNKNDSTNTVDHFVQLKSRFENSSYHYSSSNDAIDKFYKNTYYDTLKTNDSSHVKKFTNELSYAILKKDNKAGLSFGYKNEINQVWQRRDSVFMNHILLSDFVFRTPLTSRDTLNKDTLNKTEKYCETRVNFQYCLAGPLIGNYKGESKSIYTFNQNKKRNLFLNVLYENRSPDYMYNNWLSNHFVWFNNGFKSQQQIQFKLGLDLNRVFTTSIFYQSITNYLYFDQEALPKNYSKPISNIGLNLNFTKIFFKHLGLNMNYIYQSSSKASVVRIPEHSATCKLFYNGSLSHNNLLLQIGFQVQIYESFYAYAYMPSTQTFYLQNDFKTDRYPYLDAYLSARIRPVSIFLKVENALAAVAGPNFSFVPGYYQSDLAFRFGLTWMFFD
ncbi:putative porin [Aurantibacillus circumpalustris]|uniref:putative porin n=1 Tax=Aurantibacillus circumpalustris TaxID=3036359 RepID=UPI00295BAB65|nr:putative porin [Aurantibacillus circumpalustris]